MLAAGLILGILLPKWWGMGDGTYAGLFSTYYIRKYSEITVDCRQLFFHVLWKRFLLLFVLWTSGYTPLRYVTAFGYCGWLGLSGGILLALSVSAMGYSGVLFWVLAVGPQWIFYGFAIQNLMQLAIIRGAGERTALMLPAGQGTAAVSIKELVIRRIYEGAENGIPFLFLAAGAGIEGYISPWILKKFFALF